MSDTSYTIDDVHTLEQAIATGALRVRYGDKEIWYKNTADQLLALNTMKKALGIIETGSQRKYADFNKGV